MPQAAAVGAVWLAGAIGVSVAVASVIIYAAEMLALNAVLRALSPRAPKPVALPRTQALSDTLSPGKILYGMVCVGGAHIIPPIATDGTDPLDGKVYAGNWTHRALALAQHEVDSFGPVRYEQSYIDQSQIRAADNTLDSGLVLASGNIWDNVLGQTRYTMIRCYRGTATDPADYLIMQADPNAFTSSFRSRGVAVAFATFAFGDWFQGGVPPLSFCVNGKKCYDPRKDSTNGGVGTHRYLTPSTWEWTCNPILCASDLIIFDRELGGGGYDPALDVDWSLVSAAANICDASVDTAPVVTNLVSQGSGAGAVTITGNTITKTAGVNGTYDASGRSNTGIKAGRISFRGVAGGSILVAGLSSAPSTTPSYTDIDYAWSAKGVTGWQIWEGGSQVTSNPIPAGAVSSTDIAEILYDGTNILYLLNGKIIRQKKVPAIGGLLYFDSSFINVGGTLTVNQQRRYTCNLELDGSALFEDNLGYLIDAAFGRAIDRDGKWRLYAGAWDTPTFTIEQSDWVGELQIQAVTPRREGRWNGVRAFYYDALRNWQRVECNARTNAAYKTADGGERIWQELDRPAIGDESTAQRMAEFTLRQSRNGIKVSGTLPPRFQWLSTWDTGLINFADLGWTGKAFRLMGYTLNPDGSIGAAFTEEQQSDWTDMASAEFNQPDQHLIPLTNEQIPRPCTSLVATSFTESISFAIAYPKLDPGSTIGLYESPVQGTAFTGYTLVAEGKGSPIVIRKNDNISRFYRVIVKNQAGHFSTRYPPDGSNAIEGFAGSHSLIGRGVHLNGNTAYKVDTGLNVDNVWDSDLISIQGYKTCHLQFKGNTTVGGNVMVGMSSVPGATAHYSGIDYAWYNNITDWRIYESGVLVQTVAGAVKTSDTAWITYDGTFIRYYLNGVGIRTAAASNLTLFLDSSFFGFVDSAINGLEFGPTITNPLMHTTQLGAIAASQITVFSSADQNLATPGNVVNSTILNAGWVTIVGDGSPVSVDLSIGSIKITPGSLVTFWSLDFQVTRNGALIASPAPLGSDLNINGGDQTWTAGNVVKGIPTLTINVNDPAPPVGTNLYGLKIIVGSSPADAAIATKKVLVELLALSFKVREIRR